MPTIEDIHDDITLDETLCNMCYDQADNCLFGLRPGDEVHWNDPDEGTCSGHGIFVKYLNDEAAVIKKDDVEIEVFVKELS
jgi:hypothetical protein